MTVDCWWSMLKKKYENILNKSYTKYYGWVWAWDLIMPILLQYPAFFFAYSFLFMSWKKININISAMNFCTGCLLF